MSTPGLILKLVISETRLGGHLMSTILEWILISKRSHVLVPKLENKKIFKYPLRMGIFWL